MPAAVSKARSATSPVRPRRRFHAGAALLAGAVAMGACAAPAAPGWQASLRQRIGGPGSLRGDLRAIAAPAPERAVARGDVVTLGVALERAGGQDRAWRVEVAVDAVAEQHALVFRGIAPFEQRVQPGAERRRRIEAAGAAFRQRLADGDESLGGPTPVARIRVEAFGADGASLGVGDSEAFVSQLQRGLLPACRAGHRQRERMRGRVAMGLDAPMLTLEDAAYDDVQEVAAGVGACERFFGILRENPVMRDILWEVLALPSLWSILTSWGVKASFAVDFFAAEPVDPARFPGETRELWSVPLVVLLNGQPGLLAQVVVGPSGSPDGAVAGVYAIVARHPRDPDRRVQVWLQSSRRGG